MARVELRHVTADDDGRTQARHQDSPGANGYGAEWDCNGGTPVKGASLPLSCAPMTSINQVDSTLECRRGDRAQLLVQLILRLDPFG